MTPLEKRLYAIVRGQVRSFASDHPDALSGRMPVHSIANSIAKRVVPDILTLGVCWRQDAA